VGGRLCLQRARRQLVPVVAIAARPQPATKNAVIWASGSKELVAAWLEGDWSVTLGAFFDCWSAKRHVVEPFEVPKEWMRFRSMDWGSAVPFSVGWWAVVQDDFETDGRVLPRGCLVRYREWYGMKPGQPNVGVKINADVFRVMLA
jgi:hypothetical protein